MTVKNGPLHFLQGWLTKIRAHFCQQRSKFWYLAAWRPGWCYSITVLHSVRSHGADQGGSQGNCKPEVQPEYCAPSSPVDLTASPHRSTLGTRCTSQSAVTRARVHHFPSEHNVGTRPCLESGERELSSQRSGECTAVPRVER